MAKAGMSGFFATHLHEILALPLKFQERIAKKRMSVHEDEVSNEFNWTYRLTDGVCTDSMALVTAAKFGLPEEVLARAEAFSSFVPGDRSNTWSLSKQEGDLVKKPELEREARPPFDMDAVGRLVVSTTGMVPLSVPPTWSPPASLEGQSCVYVLQLEGDGQAHYYVGETDSFQQRLHQHRAKGGSWSEADSIVFPVSGGKSEARSIESILIQKMAKAGFTLRSAHDGRRLRSSRQNHAPN